MYRKAGRLMYIQPAFTRLCHIKDEDKNSANARLCNLLVIKM